MKFSVKSFNYDKYLFYNEKTTFATKSEIVQNVAKIHTNILCFIKFSVQSIIFEIKGQI